MLIWISYSRWLSVHVWVQNTVLQKLETLRQWTPRDHSSVSLPHQSLEALSMTLAHQGYLSQSGLMACDGASRHHCLLKAAAQRTANAHNRLCQVNFLSDVIEAFVLLSLIMWWKGSNCALNQENPPFALGLFKCMPAVISLLAALTVEQIYFLKYDCHCV